MSAVSINSNLGAITQKHVWFIVIATPLCLCLHEFFSMLGYIEKLGIFQAALLSLKPFYAIVNVFANQWTSEATFGFLLASPLILMAVFLFLLSKSKGNRFLFEALQISYIAIWCLVNWTIGSQIFFFQNGLASPNSEELLKIHPEIS